MTGLIPVIRAPKAVFEDAFGRFVDDEQGATAIEYGLILALIFLAIIGAVHNYADATNEMYSEISSSLE